MLTATSPLPCPRPRCNASPAACSISGKRQLFCSDGLVHSVKGTIEPRYAVRDTRPHHRRWSQPEGPGAQPKRRINDHTAANSTQDLFGKMDPYVNFQLAAATNVRAKWRCKTHNGGGKNPSWNDRHNFDVVEGDDRIQAQVYDEDAASDDLIGQTSIDLNTVFARGMRDEWFPLQARSLAHFHVFATHVVTSCPRARVAGPQARFASSFSSLPPVVRLRQCPARCQATCVLRLTAPPTALPLPLTEVASHTLSRRTFCFNLIESVLQPLAGIRLRLRMELHPAIRPSPATEVSNCDNVAAFAPRSQLELMRSFCSAPPPVWRLAARMLPRPLPCCSSLCVLACNLFLSVCCSPTAPARLRR